jgi:hypothetical protein
MAWEQLGGIAKQVGVALIAGVLGFGGKAVVESVGNGKELERDSQLIAKLFEGQAATHKDVQDLVVSETRLEGKVDVLNQKVDDLPQRSSSPAHSK